MKNLVKVGFLTLILSFGVFAQSLGVRSSYDGTVVGTISEQEVVANGIVYLVGLKSPELVLVSKSGEKLDLKSTKKFRKIFFPNWRKTIRYFYKRYFKSGSDSRVSKVGTFEKSKEYVEIKRQFRKIKIKVSGKKRRISDNESVEILAVLKKAALGIIGKAKKIKGKYKKLRVISKPLPKSENCRRNSGETLLRVLFHKSNQVKVVKLLKTSYCREFDTNAIFAAQEIKFEPATQDGKPITLIKRVQYKFTRY